MDCFTKKVMFRKPGFPKLESEGDHSVFPMSMILALEAKSLLHKGCEAYLAHVIDTSTPKMTLKNVLIIREFSNVFFEDLPRFPLDKELEFGIDLLSGSPPISIPPYSMAPAELKELKTQLSKSN